MGQTNTGSTHADLYGLSYSTVQRYMHMPESAALKLPREKDMKPKRRRK